MLTDVLTLDGPAARAALALDALCWGASPDARSRDDEGLVDVVRFGDLEVTLARPDAGAVPFVVGVAVGGRCAPCDTGALSRATTLRQLAPGDRRAHHHLPVIG